MKIAADDYKIVVQWSNEDQKYVATCPAFPFSLGGSTPEEAVREARVVLQDVIEVYDANGDPLPEPDYEMV